MTTTQNFKIEVINGTGKKIIDQNSQSEQFCVNHWTVLFSIIPIITYLIDITSDVYLAFSYFEEGKYTYGIWMLSLTLIPGLIVTFLSLHLDNEMNIDSSLWKRLTKNHIFCMAIFFSLSAPLLRHFDCLFYAFKLRLAEKRKDKEEHERYSIKYQQEVNARNRITFLECYLKSIPQLILQETIMLIKLIGGSPWNAKLLFSISSSLVSTAWRLATCEESADKSLEIPKETDEVYEEIVWAVKITKLAGVAQHLFVITSNTLSISLVASICPLYMCIAIGIYWMGLNVLFFYYLETIRRKALWSIFLSFIHMFSPPSETSHHHFHYAVRSLPGLYDGPNYFFYIILITVYYIENMAVIIWGFFVSESGSHVWTGYSLIIILFGYMGHCLYLNLKLNFILLCKAGKSCLDRSSARRSSLEYPLRFGRPQATQAVPIHGRPVLGQFGNGHDLPFGIYRRHSFDEGYRGV